MLWIIYAVMAIKIKYFNDDMQSEYDLEYHCPLLLL